MVRTRQQQAEGKQQKCASSVKAHLRVDEDARVKGLDAERIANQDQQGIQAGQQRQQLSVHDAAPRVE